MRIWVVKYGETIPFADPDAGHHFFRSGDLTRRLAARGHEVTWWTGRFEHQTKRHLPTDGDEIPIPGTKSKVRLIDSRGYESNFSLKRFADHAEIGRNFRRAIEFEDRPHVIVASMPTPELALAAADFAYEHHIPLIIDVRDMWPDAIIERVKEKTGIPTSWFFHSYKRALQRCVKQARSVTAISPQMLQWAHEAGGRPLSYRRDDRVFRLASTRLSTDSQQDDQARARWAERGFSPVNNKVVFSLAGTLTDQKAMRALLEAQGQLPEDVRSDIQIVICGKGDLEREVRAAREAYSYLLYAGFVPRSDVQFLYDNSDHGLLFYDNTPDFQGSFPNKFGEYLMSGLPVVTTIDGAMQKEYGSEGFITTVDPSPSSIAGAISDLARRPRDPAPRARAMAVFEHDFNADVVYEAFCDHIELAATNRLTKIETDRLELNDDR